MTVSVDWTAEPVTWTAEPLREGPEQAMDVLRHADAALADRMTHPAGPSRQTFTLPVFPGRRRTRTVPAAYPPATLIIRDAYLLYTHPGYWTEAVDITVRLLHYGRQCGISVTVGTLPSAACTGGSTIIRRAAADAGPAASPTAEMIAADPGIAVALVNHAITQVDPGPETITVILPDRDTVTVDWGSSTVLGSRHVPAGHRRKMEMIRDQVRDKLGQELIVKLPAMLLASTNGAVIDLHDTGCRVGWTYPADALP